MFTPGFRRRLRHFQFCRALRAHRHHHVFLGNSAAAEELRAHADLVKNVRRGDTIVMTGGLIGKVSRVIDDNEVELEIAPNVKVRVSRAQISEVRSKGEPVKDAA